MEESITQMTEKNVVVRDWSLKTQREKGDSLVEGCVANLPEHTTVNVRQNNLEDLVRVWNQWDSETRGIFTEKYGDIAHLITIRVDEQLIQAMVRFWDPAYQCFTFNQEDMTPTIEEYAALLRIDNVQFRKIYVKEPKPMTFKKKLVRLTDMTDAWAEKQIKKKNETICIPWSSLRESVLSHPDILKRVNLFALAIYGLVIFPRVLRHLEVAAKTRSQPCPDYLSRDIQVPEYLSKGWKRMIYRMCTAAQCLDFESFLESRAHSIPHVFKNIRPARSLPQERMAERSHRATLGISFSESSRRGYKVESTLDPSFSPAIQMWKPRFGLAQCEFAFAGEGYMKRVRDIAKSWKEIHFMELALYADTLTQDYDIWRKQRVNSQRISSINYTAQNPFLEEMPSELEIARQEFKREKAKMSRDLSTLQEENYQLKIEVQVERSRTKKVQREAEIVRNDLRDLHLENKKLRNTIKNSGLGKSTAEWKEEISNIKGGMEFWKGKAKKEEEKAARAAIELRKKNAEYEMVTAEFANSQSEHQELKRRAQDLENMLQSRQQQLDNLLKALEEKNDQYDRDMHAYEGTLQEKERQLDFLINEIRKAAMQVVQFSDEAEVLSYQFPPSQRSSISEF
ncbi:hypothetical protein CXB51_024697 [Gossypium anomalum]|uniref:DUF7745 domain-containing protein n=1 Tax=Gossypium anomalum TaxID=47600 RepID=A0A8J5YQ17_9ROSI|nr:hypothetical protein CXB51_024697 [Gossypium anomalum]